MLVNVMGLWLELVSKNCWLAGVVVGFKFYIFLFVLFVSYINNNNNNNQKQNKKNSVCKNIYIYKEMLP